MWLWDWLVVKTRAHSSICATVAIIFWPYMGLCQPYYKGKLLDVSFCYKNLFVWREACEKSAIPLWVAYLRVMLFSHSLEPKTLCWGGTRREILEQCACAFGHQNEITFLHDFPFKFIICLTDEIRLAARSLPLSRDRYNSESSVRSQIPAASVIYGGAQRLTYDVRDQRSTSCNLNENGLLSDTPRTSDHVKHSLTEGVKYGKAKGKKYSVKLFWNQNKMFENIRPVNSILVKSFCELLCLVKYFVQ